jgi:DNA-binding transcriptional MerR regulator
MTAESTPEDELLTVDELAAAAGLTVRTTRYYASLGLLPPPTRQGRLAYYGEQHQARLELIRALQDHGFTLSAIERYFERMPVHATAEELAVQRVLLTPWAAPRVETVTLKHLETRARRKLTSEQLAWLERIGALRKEGDLFELLPSFSISIQLLDLDIPPESIEDADEAIRRHMDALAGELTGIMRTKVVAPYREGEHGEGDDARFERSMGKLRQLTLEALIVAFQRAANNGIVRSLDRDGDAVDPEAGE